MSRKVNFSIPYDNDLESFLEKNHSPFADYRILSESLDARGANRGVSPKIQYTIELVQNGEEFDQNIEKFENLGPFKNPPIIIGAGPAGLFCALRLAEYGIPSLIFERGEKASERMKKISKYWRKGDLDTENNVCYGEGGAGLFSDGKLITRIKSKFIDYVMNKFVELGAPKEVAYLSNPHLGSNKIRLLIGKLTDQLKEKNCTIHYQSRVEELLFDEKNLQKVVGVKVFHLDQQRTVNYFSDHVVLATGHSAKEIYHHLNDHKVGMSFKDFAIGVRMEHPRRLIDKLQLGEYAKEPKLNSMRYVLKYHDQKTDRGTYSFCMCPGGHVLSTTTHHGSLVVNGMSNYARNSPWSNAALVVTVKAGIDFEAKNDPLSGLKFIESIEKKAFDLSHEMKSGKEIPAITIDEFMNNKITDLPLPATSCPSGIFKADFNKIFPPFIINHLKGALLEFEKKLKGLLCKEALLLAPETRTSAPLTILRDKITLMSTTHENLYPAGEGAGHAGGITSSAVDGVKIAESIIQQVKC